jgi:pimeloyl-ACP methyl ester carboxylesterase
MAIIVTTTPRADVVIVGSGSCGPGYIQPELLDAGVGRQVLAVQARIPAQDCTEPLAGAAAGLAHELDVTRTGGRRFDLVAAGWGGAVALQLAADRPDLVRRLAVAAPSGAGRSVLGQPAVPLAELLRATWARDERSQERVVLALGSMAAAYLAAAPADVPEAAEQQRILAAVEAGQRSLPLVLRMVAAPTLLLWGQQDQVEPLDRGMFLHRRLPVSSLRVFAGAGHLLADERPAEVRQVIAQFFALV